MLAVDLVWTETILPTAHILTLTTYLCHHQAGLDVGQPQL